MLNVNSAPRLCAHSLAQVLYVEVTVSEKDDARLYKALVRWLTERGHLASVNRYKAVSTTLRELREASGDGGGGGKGGGKGGGGGRRAARAAPTSFHATSAIELLPAAAVETHRFTFRGSWCWAAVGGGGGEEAEGGGLALIGSMRSGPAKKLARAAARRNSASPWITLTALQGRAAPAMAATTASPVTLLASLAEGGGVSDEDEKSGGSSGSGSSGGGSGGGAGAGVGAGSSGEGNSAGGKAAPPPALNFSFRGGGGRGGPPCAGMASLAALLQEALDEAARSDHRYLEVYDLLVPAGEAARWDLASLARKRCGVHNCITSAHASMY